MDLKVLKGLEKISQQAGKCPDLVQGGRKYISKTR